MVSTLPSRGTCRAQAGGHAGILGALERPPQETRGWRTASSRKLLLYNVRLLPHVSKCG